MKNVLNVFLPEPHPHLHPPIVSPRPSIHGPGVGRKSTDGRGLRKGAGLGEAPSLLCRLGPRGLLGAPFRASAPACAEGAR